MFVQERQLRASAPTSVTVEELAQKLTHLFDHQQGFQKCLIGRDGDDLKIMSIWRSEENYREFVAGDDGGRVDEMVHAAGFVFIDEHQHTNMAVIEPFIGELRVIQATVVPEEMERIQNYWLSAGQELNQTAPGCVRADAFVHSEESQLHFVVWWRSPEDAKHFRYTDHLDGELARGFGTGLRSFSRYSLAHVTS